MEWHTGCVVERKGQSSFTECHLPSGLLDEREGGIFCLIMSFLPKTEGEARLELK